MKDHRDVQSSQLVQSLRIRTEYVIPLEEDLATLDDGRWMGKDPQDGLHGRRLATARLSYQADLLAFAELQVHSVQDLERALEDLVVNVEILYVQERLCHD